MAAPVWTPAYVALGSNLDDPPQQLRRACASIVGIPDTRLIAVSAFYRNPPLGEPDQPDFVNAVAAILTHLSPRGLLAKLKEIERVHGRIRVEGGRWGPRVIDLDLLVHGVACINEEGLNLPHPGIADRNFVLFPLLEIAPGLEVPGIGRVVDLAARLDRSGLVRVD